MCLCVFAHMYMRGYSPSVSSSEYCLEALGSSPQCRISLWQIASLF